MKRNLAIKAENISKQYRLGEVGTGTLTHDLNRAWARLRGKEDPYLKIGESNDRSSKGNSEYVWSLKDINFEIEKGDAVGIIGRNGAGKSTLLKLLSRVTKPTTGHFEVNGRIASLLEVGTGFNPEMTGRENIFLNGAILGMRRHEIKRKFDEIVDFSGVERYIDTPVKRYSSGMYVRLAFAVAAHLESEILIVDEVLAVGDAEFQKKCLGKMGDVSKGEGRTVLFVSHNMAAISKLCNIGVLLENGRIKTLGEITGVLSTYKAGFNESKNGFERKKPVSGIGLSKANFSKKKTEFFNTDSIEIDVEIETTIDIPNNTRLLFRVMDEDEQAIFASEIQLSDINKKFQITIDENKLVNGNYLLNFVIYQPGVTGYDNVTCCNFNIINNNSEFSHLEYYDIGKVYMPIQWKY